MEIRMVFCGKAEKDILNIIMKSLKDGNESGFKPGFRSGFKSDRNRYEDFHNKSRGSYGGSSYDSGGSKGRDSGGAGSSNYGSGHEDKSSGSQAKKFSLDDYEILGLSKTATLSDVKKQYRKLALEHHPGCPIKIIPLMISILMFMFTCRQEHAFVQRRSITKTRIDETHQFSL